MSSNTLLKIMICCHKPCITLQDDIFLPIQVGKEISSYSLPMQADNQVNGNTCDNISEYNPLFCEMTAWYWGWKNIRTLYPDLQYIGLCHYRRYFSLSNRTIRRSVKHIIKNFILMGKVILGKNIPIMKDLFIRRIKTLQDSSITQLNQFLKTNITHYDVLVPQPVLYYATVYDAFSVIGREYYNLLEIIIKEKYPQYYPFYQQTMRGTKLYCANMVILKIDLLDEYGKFVFGALMEHLKRVKEEHYCDNPLSEKMYARVPGYLAEILTNTYILKCKNDGYKFYFCQRAFIENINTDLEQ